MTVAIIKTVIAVLWVVLLVGKTSAQSAAHTLQSRIKPLTESLSDQSARSEFGRIWGLTDSEVARYQTIMNGRRGLWTPGIDPLLALGVQAKNSAERRRYAERLVQADFERTERELAFQREVSAAWKRLFPNTMRLRSPPSEVATRLERFAVFARRDCDECAELINRSLSKAGANSVPLDIYLADSGGSDAVLRSWAHDLQLPPNLVTEGMLTLNHVDESDPNDAPALYVKRKGMPWERQL